MKRIEQLISKLEFTKEGHHKIGKRFWIASIHDKDRKVLGFRIYIKNEGEYLERGELEKLYNLLKTWKRRGWF